MYNKADGRTHKGLDWMHTYGLVCLSEPQFPHWGKIPILLTWLFGGSVE